MVIKNHINMVETVEVLSEIELEDIDTKKTTNCGDVYYVSKK